MTIWVFNESNGHSDGGTLSKKEQAAFHRSDKALFYIYWQISKIQKAMESLCPEQLKLFLCFFKIILPSSCYFKSNLSPNSSKREGFPPWTDLDLQMPLCFKLWATARQDSFVKFNETFFCSVNSKSHWVEILRVVILHWSFLFADPEPVSKRELKEAAANFFPCISAHFSHHSSLLLGSQANQMIYRVCD